MFSLLAAFAHVNVRSYAFVSLTDQSSLSLSLSLSFSLSLLLSFCVYFQHGNYVPNLTIVPVTAMNEVTELLAIADKNRSTASTNMNEHSSRSHLMLSVYVSSRNRLSGAATWGKLHLVDLAGR
jgi:hypothetical protein